MGLLIELFAAAIEADGAIGDVAISQPVKSHKHLPGQHDQSTHGSGSGISYTKEDVTESIEQYTSTWHARINHALRAGTDDDDTLDHVKRLRYAFETEGMHETFSEPTDVHRGIWDANVVDKMSRLSVGDTFGDRAFLSTTTDEDLANEFANGPRGERGAVISFNVGEGTKFLAGETDEHEAILEPGIKLRVNNTAIVNGRLFINASRHETKGKGQHIWLPLSEPYTDLEKLAKHLPGQHDQSTHGTGGGPAVEEQEPSDRAARALASHNPSTAEKQRASDRFEAEVAKKIGAKRTKDNSPMDNILDDRHGVEIKALHDAKEGRVNMRPDSRQRKEQWAREGKGRTLHTVLIDNRDKFQDGAHADKYSGHKMYYAKGVAAFRLGQMTKVKSHSDLKKLVRGDKATMEAYGL